MKKIISILALTICAASFASAQEDYSFGATSKAGVYINRGESTMFTAMKDLSLTFSLVGNTTGASSLNFGVYTFDSAGTINQYTISDIGNLANSVSYNFNAGDQIAFWLEVDGKTIYSVHPLNKNGITFDGWQKNGADLLFGFETNGNWYTGLNNTDLQVNIHAGAPVSQPPSGQPLPSVLATIAIGLSGFVMYIKRRKS